jgi:hypothetical protein
MKPSSLWKALIAAPLIPLLMASNCVKTIEPTITITPEVSAMVAGAANTTFTATIQNGAGTINWALSPESGVGSIAQKSGPSTTYTPPATVSSATTATITATLAGTTVTARTTFTINPSTFSFTVDPSIHPSPATTGDGRGGTLPLAASKDESGVRSEFIANQVLFMPKNQAELDAFLARTGGTVVGDDAIPAPPPELGITVAPQDLKATTFTVQLDPSSFSLERFKADSTTAGLNGKLTVSSEAAARLMALAVGEVAAGRTAGLNYIDRPDSVMTRTDERPSGDGFVDAFKTTRFEATGSKSNVLGAWQWLRAKGIARRVRVAIIDGGFWVNTSNGQPLSVAGIGTDLPASPLQYDFVNNDFQVGGTNPSNCTGGSACPWHGNGSAGVATGLVNNRAGEAGTGGLVSEPMLFHTALGKSEQKRALSTARAWQADVINMSYGGACDYWCRWNERIVGYDKEIERVRAAGIIMVASAGNDGKNVDTEYYHPCNYDGVICVGALNNYKNTPQGYSNYGGSVDIWAPTDIPVMPNGSNIVAGNSFSGTSASAPFVAGIAAMMRAINPTLTGDQVSGILRDTAWKDSGDSKVSHYVNALEAIKRASNNVLPSDRFEPNPMASPSPVGAGQHDDLTSNMSESDNYRFTANGPSKLTLNFTKPDNIGRLGVGYGLIKDSGCGWQEELENATNTNARKLVYRLASGVYTLGVTSSAPLPYDMQVNVEGTPIASDRYEPNNNLAQKTYLFDGRPLNATLHAGDVDYYEFYSAGSLPVAQGLYGFDSVIEVVAADNPITLTLYDAKGNVAGTSSSSANCDVLAKLNNLPAGYWRFSVTSNAPGSYAIFAGQKVLRGSPLFDMESFWRLLMNPGDPIEFHVRDRFEIAALRFNQDGVPNGLDLYTSGLHLTLFDDNGQQVSEGVQTDFQGTMGEVLDLRQTQPDARYFLRFDRTENADAVDGQLPVITAKLKLK